MTSKSLALLSMFPIASLAGCVMGRWDEATKVYERLHSVESVLVFDSGAVALEMHATYSNARQGHGILRFVAGRSRTVRGTIARIRVRDSSSPVLVGSLPVRGVKIGKLAPRERWRVVPSSFRAPAAKIEDLPADFRGPYIRYEPDELASVWIGHEWVEVDFSKCHTIPGLQRWRRKWWAYPTFPFVAAGDVVATGLYIVTAPVTYPLVYFYYVTRTR